MKLNSDIKVLFIGHGANRSGAPLLLKEFLSFLKKSEFLGTHLLLLADGPLAADYQTLCKTDLLNGEVSNNDAFLPTIRTICKIITSNLIRSRTKNLLELYPLNKYPVIYANTIASTATAMDLYLPGRIIIQHVHELSYASDALQVRETLKESVDKTHLFIAASQVVAKFLREEIHVDESKIRIIHEFPVIPSQNSQSSSRNEIRNALGVKDDDFLIGMCGTPEWRKGVDLFVQLGERLRQKLNGKSYHLLWVGGSNKQLLEAAHDAKILELTSNVHFVGNVISPLPYYEAMDLFTLTSREDPFSVAMLEAAASGLPIICFDNAGGGEEFVENNAGITVPYMDIQKMADICEDLFNNVQLRLNLGESAKRKVEIYYSPHCQMSKQLAVIQEALIGFSGN